MYDVTENRKRTKLQKKLLKNDWTMLQYSVYIKYCNKQEIRELEKKVEHLVDQNRHDSLYFTKVHLPSLLSGALAGKIRQYLSEEIEQIFI